MPSRLYKLAKRVKRFYNGHPYQKPKYDEDRKNTSNELFVRESDDPENHISKTQENLPPVKETTPYVQETDPMSDSVSLKVDKSTLTIPEETVEVGVYKELEDDSETLESKDYDSYFKILSSEFPQIEVEAGKSIISVELTVESDELKHESSDSYCNHNNVDKNEMYSKREDDEPDKILSAKSSDDEYNNNLDKYEMHSQREDDESDKILCAKSSDDEYITPKKQVRGCEKQKETNTPIRELIKSEIMKKDVMEFIVLESVESSNIVIRFLESDSSSACNEEEYKHFINIDKGSSQEIKKV